MNVPILRGALLALVPVLGLCALPAQDEAAAAERTNKKESAVQIQYLEIVTPEVDATCRSLAKLHGVEFSKPQPELGNARTASLKGGGQIGVRAPMRDTEAPVVRPYVLVDDIEAAVEAVSAAGAEVALPPMPIPERGRFAIYIQGGIQHGLWER